ncbi:BCCT family transporter [Leeuwenhoekiella sp. MAR_2009_132]|uniref:BCCT family transporter n=1 Tax=Leeuwenhoekiella sp. MAR_2009_132 TaxID=1392489 RepID=UPI00048A5292|nr:BCCT family transporter [Leeuwenhoekiella sp. MAR_2009_132]
MILLIICFFFYAFTEESYNIIENISLEVRNYFGQFYLVLGLCCVLILVAVAISKWGTYKLGKSNEKPAFSRMAWVSMLYSAGMGAGILLRAVQEPVYMLLNPPINTNASKQTIALEFTFYQWGFTAWAFYALFALAIGTAVFKFSRPVLTSSTIFNNLENKEHKLKFTGRFIIDLLTLLTTVFGLVAAVGLGASQIKGGLDHLLGITLSSNYIIALILVVGVLSLTSALSGVEKGIKRLSTANIYLTLALLFFVIIQSDVIAILKQFAISFYHYVVDFIPMSLALGNYNPGTQFLTDWTYYYWAFWIAWAPFTGIFIARISRGRTIREIIIGVLLLPSLGTFLWFTVFGQSAFELITSWQMYSGEFDNVFTSLFVFLSNYPLQVVVNSIVVLLLIGFLVTSLDSAIYVLSTFTSTATKEPSKSHRILWSIILTLSAVGLVILGFVRKESNVLIAAQKLLIITSLPLSLFMVWMILKWLMNLSHWKK